MCAVVVGLSGLTLCQPPAPRIARVEASLFPTANNAEMKDILSVSSRVERVIQLPDPGTPLIRDVSCRW
jgi:hypothetical protein